MPPTTPPTTATDPFRVLAVPYTATPADVAAAFRRAALDTHPDTNPGADGAAFRAAREAYDALRTPARLAAARRRWRPNPARPTPPPRSDSHPGWVWPAAWAFDPDEFPECPSTTTPRTPDAANPATFTITHDVYNPPAGWTPGTRPPPASACLYHITNADDPSRAGGRDWGVWAVPGLPPRFVFGPAPPPWPR